MATSPDPVESMPLGGTTSKTTSEGPPSSKWQVILPWNKVLKLSHVEAFGQDSDLVKETSKEFFLKHSYNLIIKAPVISQRYFGRWPQVPSYWALPSTRSRHH